MVVYPKLNVYICVFVYVYFVYMYICVYTYCLCVHIYRYLFMYAAYTHDLRAHKFFKYKIKYRNKWIQQNGFTIYYLI